MLGQGAGGAQPCRGPVVGLVLLEGASGLRDGSAGEALPAACPVGPTSVAPAVPAVGAAATPRPPTRASSTPLRSAPVAGAALAAAAAGAEGCRGLCPGLVHFSPGGVVSERAGLSSLALLCGRCSLLPNREPPRCCNGPKTTHCLPYLSPVACRGRGRGRGGGGGGFSRDYNEPAYGGGGDYGGYSSHQGIGGEIDYETQDRF